MLLRRTHAGITALALAAALLPATASAQWPANGKALAAATGDQRYPALISDQAGGMIATWEDQRSGASDIYALRVNAAGKLVVGWNTNGNAVCTMTGDQKAPVAVGDGLGGALFAWEDYRAGGGNADIFVMRLASNGSMVPGWGTSGRNVCNLTGSQRLPSICSDGAGGAIVVWQDFRGGATTDIYAQRVNGSGTVQWAAAGVPVCLATGNQYYASVIADGSGGAIITWQDERGTSADVYAQRLNSSGVAQWTPDGVLVCGAASEQYTPRLVSDGGAGTIISWDDYRNDNADVYAQRLNSLGAPQWPANGVALCTNAFEQYSGAPTADGAGGAYVPWADYRNTLGDIYVQRVTSAGTISPGWKPNGDSLCVANGNQQDPAAVSDGAGGVFVVWDDNRPSAVATDIYMQHLTGAGAVSSGWPTDGWLVCNATGDQNVPMIASDASGGAYLAWSDQRTGALDVYGTRFTASGGAPTVDVPLDEGGVFETVSAAPNPLVTQTQVSFRLANEARVSAMVVDVEGRRVRELAADETMLAGPHTLVWDGRDQTGASVPGGIYLLALHAGPDSRVQKLAVLR